MEYLAVASASVAGPLPRLSSPSAVKHMFNVLGREAREGPYTQDQARRLMAGSARVNVASLNQVFLVLMMLVHWLYLKVNSRREGACSQRRCGESPVQSLRVSSEDRRTTVRGQTVKQCTELQSALDFFATRQLNGVHSSQSPSCPADGVFSLITPRRPVCASAPRTVVDAHTSRLYVGSNASLWTV